ncbi:MAG: C10 family peptidase [Prevotella sp.]|nr:C10 family peptidase [Prevotella sp.]
MQTKWGQNTPFNLLCPKDSVSGQNALAGCGPIAMAQIIRYTEQPAVSPSGDSYQWDLMTAQPATLQEGLAIAKLVADCGVNAFTSYGRENSSTRTQNLVNALKKYRPVMPGNWQNCFRSKSGPGCIT